MEARDEGRPLGKRDRRDRIALDEAYRFYRSTIKEDHTPELFALVKALQTVSNALQVSGSGEFQLTVRLWNRIQQSLFDRLVTSYPAHVLVFDESGQPLASKSDWRDDCMIEIYPDGLRRDDDSFRMEVSNLHPVTRHRLVKVWKERGPSTKREDFANMDECGDVCAPKPFLIGDEVLLQESLDGKAKAYKRWWNLYWQSYCSGDNEDKILMTKQMNALEAVWGNLYY